MTLLSLLPLAMDTTVWVVLIVVGLLVLLLLAILVFRFFNLWIQCITTGAEIGFIDLVAMSLRKINPRVIVQSKIAAVQAGLEIQTRRPRQPAARLPRRDRHRPGRPRHPRRGADVREAARDQLPRSEPVEEHRELERLAGADPRFA